MLNNSTAELTNQENKNKVTIDVMSFLMQTIEQWQVHRCQVTHCHIGHDEPMKLIYHYETLSDVIKERYPLNGQLLSYFDRIMTREEFAQLSGIPLKQIAKPWQLKFAGKLVIFHQQPDIALRLHWVNTLKAFEPIIVSPQRSESDGLDYAIENAFKNWHIIEQVEIINKNPQVQLTYTDNINVIDVEHPSVKFIPTSNQFIQLPSDLGLQVMQYLQNTPEIAKSWLELMKSASKNCVQARIEQTQETDIVG